MDVGIGEADAAFVDVAALSTLQTRVPFESKLISRDLSQVTMITPMTVLPQ